MSFTIRKSTGAVDAKISATVECLGYAGMTVPRGYRVALVDVDSMFVSCERVFDPRLWNKPVVVLSNNDGCVISRSQEAKQVGVAMCQPWFEIAAVPRLARTVIARSSNYELYGDISRRLMSILEDFTPYVQVYSIDEAFLLLPQEQALTLAHTIYTTIAQYLNIPVTIGVGATKTLAKIAAHHAKNDPAMHPVCAIEPVDTVTSTDVSVLSLACLNATPVQQVWGVGRRLVQKFIQLGIETAADLAAYDPHSMRKKFSLTQERIVRELNQQSCIPFYDEPPIKHQLTYSRLFGQPITNRSDMAYALASYADKACRKLRSKHLTTGVVSISVSTSGHHAPIQRNHIIVRLYTPTSNTSEVIHAAHKILPHIHEGTRYARANITLTELYPAHSLTTLCQSIPFPEPAIPQKKGETYHYASTSSPTHPCNAVVDTIVQRFGNRAIGYGHSGIKKCTQWDTRRQYLSPAYSTQWSQLLTVN